MSRSSVWLSTDTKPELRRTFLAIPRPHAAEEQANPLCILGDVGGPIIHPISRAWSQATVRIALRWIAKCIRHVVQHKDWMGDAGRIHPRIESRPKELPLRNERIACFITKDDIAISTNSRRVAAKKPDKRVRVTQGRHVRIFSTRPRVPAQHFCLARRHQIYSWTLRSFCQGQHWRSRPEF